MNNTDGNDGRRLRKLVTTGLTAVGILLAASAGAVTPADKCESAKLKTAGKYGFCRLLAESKATKTGSAPDYAKCDAKYAPKWTAIESTGGGQCPSNGDQAAIQSFVAQHADDLATALDGGGLPTCPADLAACNTDLTAALACGNGTAEGDEDCDGADLDGASCATEGFSDGTLACGSGCSFDTSACWTIRFVDNGDGTVTDRETDLTWEKKTTGVGSGVNLADAHDVDNTYKWSSIVGLASPDGTAFTDFLYRLNGGTSPDGSATSGCFAGHCDWRLPTIQELVTIEDLDAPGCGGGSPCIFADFGPTQSAYYWSATTLAGSPATAWVVNFLDGLLNADLKGFVYYVRAVRGGS